MLITFAQASAATTSSIFGLKLPVAVSYKFAKLAKLLQAELQSFDESRKTLIDEHHGILSADGSQFSFAPEDQKAFAEAVKDLLDTTIDIGHHFPMKLEMLGTAELSAGDLLQVEFLFSTEDDAPAADAVN